MHTINESPICYSLSKSSSDINLQNLLELNVNLNPITIKEHECPNKFNLKYTDEYFCINDDDKEEKESNESGENSGTTAAESIFSPVTPQCNLNERYFYQNRKISSPMCSYYESSHKAISEFLDKKLYDYSKSNNYIEKSSVTPKGNIYYGYIPMMQSRMIDLYDKKELNNKEEQIEKKMNTPLKLSSKMNFSFFCKNNNNQGNPVKKHKPFMEREGDWVCSKCKNLNFAFRTRCNRCHLQKSELEKRNNTKYNNNCNTNNQYN